MPKTVIIAEVGTSHEGSLEKAIKLIDLSCTCGADCIKFQWVYAHEILHPKTGNVDLPSGNIPLYERFKQLEVRPQFFNEVKDYIHSKGKTFMCSPFGTQSLNELFYVRPDYIKIASPELNHVPLLKHLVSLELNEPVDKRIPIILSTGVSTLEDINLALSIFKPIREHISLLHCVTSYPAPLEDYNVSILTLYKDLFSIDLGISDHSLDPIVIPLLNLAFGGRYIEKHITLDNTDSGLDDPVALNEFSFTKMVEHIRSFDGKNKDTILSYLYEVYGEQKINVAIGNGKKQLAESEKANYGRTNRSIHYMRSMKKGDMILESDIAVLRTEKHLSVGVSPQFYDEIIGKTLCVDIEDGQGVLFEHFTI